MQIKLVVLDPAVKPTKVVGHRIQNIFCKYIFISFAKEPRKSTVALNVCKAAFRLNAPIQAKFLEFANQKGGIVI